MTANFGLQICVHNQWGRHVVATEASRGTRKAYICVCVYIHIPTCVTDYRPMKLRQKVDWPSQDKVIGDSFPTNWHSKMRVEGQLREEAGPCPDHIFLILEVRRSPQLHICRNTPWKPKESIVKRYSLPISLSSKSILTKICVHTRERILRYTKYGLHTWQVRMIGQGHLGEVLHKIIQTAVTARLQGSPSESAYPHGLCFFSS